ncbi:MAG TPA: ABC transporter permease [Candidatus Binatia bacterium]|nr:ABC transporter permease [Candidatus Binatia bacterium]
MGRMGVFLATTLLYVFLPPLQSTQFTRRVHFIGTRSLLLIIFTGAFTGMVVAFQGYIALRRFGGEDFLGPGVGLSLIRELGPVLSALMITARAGSALAAELGIMRITEQIDALEVMALNPIKYLVVPILLAALLTFPLLSGVFVVVGVYGGFLVGVKLLGVSSGAYFSQMSSAVTSEDIWNGFYKSLSFGVIVAWVCCFKGFYAERGAEGVSHATTQAVVMTSVLILVWDYFLTSVLFR